MASRRSEESAWVADVEKAVADVHASAEESARWRRHSIYRVPACIKDLNRKAYQPQVVSLGPFHHGEPHLRPMDAHKRRSLVHFLRRARRPLSEFAAAVGDAVERLEGAYQGLGDEWRGGERFLELMVTDGCFLLEVMRTANRREVNDYADDDPVFSAHGLLYTVPYIRRDMLMIENQLPLLVLDRLLAVESGKEGASFTSSRSYGRSVFGVEDWEDSMDFELRRIGGRPTRQRRQMWACYRRRRTSDGPVPGQTGERKNELLPREGQCSKIR